MVRCLILPTASDGFDHMAFFLTGDLRNEILQGARGR